MGGRGLIFYDVGGRFFSFLHPRIFNISYILLNKTNILRSQV
nr:MAG TPA: hypothetical protein [Caudoviricetes sp.]